MLGLIVKGDRFVAARAAANRGIPFVFDNEIPGDPPWTVGLVGEQHQDKVAWWFVNPTAFNREASYALGTLLSWFRFRASQ